MNFGSAFVQVTEVAKKSEDSALGLEVRVEKGCMSRAEVGAMDGLEYSADRRCWVGRKIEETREAIKGREAKERRELDRSLKISMGACTGLH